MGKNSDFKGNKGGVADEKNRVIVQNAMRPIKKKERGCTFVKNPGLRKQYKEKEDEN